MLDITTIEDGGDSIILGLHGEIRDDDARVKLITFVTQNCIDDGPHSILLRFDHLNHLDLESTLTLRGLFEEAARRGKVLRVAGANSEARQKLKSLGLLV
jgi:anti-anti-sigma regulatory factor